MRIDFDEINAPDDQGFWKDEKSGQTFGGAYVSPLLHKNLKIVEEGFKKAMKDEKFLTEMYEGLDDFIGINTPILYSKKLTEIAGGEKKIGKIFLNSFTLDPTIKVSDASFALIGAPDIGASIIVILSGDCRKNCFKNAGDNVEHIINVLGVFNLKSPLWPSQSSNV